MRPECTFILKRYKSCSLDRAAPSAASAGEDMENTRRQDKRDTEISSSKKIHLTRRYLQSSTFKTMSHLDTKQTQHPVNTFNIPIKRELEGCC
jgi:hypothetical protein